MELITEDKKVEMANKIRSIVTSLNDASEEAAALGLETHLEEINATALGDSVTHHIWEPIIFISSTKIY